MGAEQRNPCAIFVKGLLLLSQQRIFFSPQVEPLPKKNFCWALAGLCCRGWAAASTQSVACETLAVALLASWAASG